MAAFVDSGRPLDRDDSDELSQRIAWHWDQYGFGLWAAVVKESA